MIYWHEMTATRAISFSSDNYRLSGTLHRPRNPRPPVVIGSHGLYSNGNSPKQIALAEACCRAGIAYLRFDHRGCGDSQGQFTDAMSFSGRCRDVTHALGFVRDTLGFDRGVGLFGSSLGGAVCLHVASIHAMDCLVSYAAPISSRSVRRGILNSGQPVSPRDLDALKLLTFDVSEGLERIRHLLIFHGEKDDVVPLSHTRKIYAKAGFPKKVIVQPNGDHPMSQPANQNEFIRLSVDWFARCWNRSPL